PFAAQSARKGPARRPAAARPGAQRSRPCKGCGVTQPERSGSAETEVHRGGRQNQGRTARKLVRKLRPLPGFLQLQTGPLSALPRQAGAGFWLVLLMDRTDVTPHARPVSSDPLETNAAVATVPIG